MKRTLSVLVSSLILVLLYKNQPFEAIVTILSQAQHHYLILALFMTAPLLFTISMRLQYLTPKKWLITFKESSQLALLGNFLNLILPAKMGDISKAYFFKTHHQIKGKTALSLMLYEKGQDMVSALTFCLLGLSFSAFLMHYINIFTLVFIINILGIITCLSLPFTRLWITLFQKKPFKFIPLIPKLIHSWETVLKDLKSDPQRLFQAWTLTFLASICHYFQLWFLLQALTNQVPLIIFIALIPLGILAGLLPLTISGIGTRDAALVFLLTPYIGKQTAIAFGILATLRLLIIALPGSLYIGRYLTQPKNLKENLLSNHT